MNLLRIEISQNRVYGLDILRAVAITFVVYAHGANMLSDYISKRLLKIPVLDGVSIFFVLSGFLVGGILIKTTETKTFNLSALMEFWKRRWYRTLPNYFLILMLLTVLTGNGAVIDFIKYFLFLQNFSFPHPDFFSEAWSLSVEEWFYLLIPSGSFLAIKSGLKAKHSVLLLIITILITSVCIRYYKFSTIDIESIQAWDANFRKQVITRLDSIMFGVLGAYLSYYHNHSWLQYRKQLLIAGVVVLIMHKLSFLLRVPFSLELNGYYCVYSFSISSFGTLLLLPFLSTYKNGSGGIYRFITTISLISYSMYLIHLSLVQSYFIPLLKNMMPVSMNGMGQALTDYSIYWVVTMMASILIYKYFELPCTQLRDKTFFSNPFCSIRDK